jgi:hypothetical protein
MGGGGGCVIKTISLKAYQKKVGVKVMTVDTNTDTYTFVSGTSHTIKCYNIEFAKNDKLVIAEGANVILESPLTIEEETKGIARITINGSLTLEEGSAITFGSIIFDPIGNRGASGIVVNSSNSLYINGGEITIDTINGIEDDRPNNLLFVKEEGSVIMNDGSITINSIKNGAAGIVLFGDKATFTQNGGSITIDKVIIENDDDSAFSLGLIIFNGGTFNQIDGSITINKLIKVSDINTDLSAICIGILISSNEKNASKFNQRGGSITIEDLQSNFGISINLTAFVIGGGDLLSQFEQTGGSITVKNVGNQGFGVLVGSTEKPTFFVNNLTVIGNEDSESSIGLVSAREDEYEDSGVVNSGIVRVYGTKFYYVDKLTVDNIEETNPSPTNDPNNNTNFTGTGKYYNTKEN